MQKKAPIGYPKKEKKKRKKTHGKSIIQRPEDKGHKAEADGLTVRLCTDHHYEVHHNADSRQRLCAIAQRAYERTHTRDEWMERYKKNYLEE